MANRIRVCVAGATGWTGSALVAALLKSPEFHLTGAVARKAAGQDAGTALGLKAANVLIAPTVAEALKAPADVLVDFTRADAVKANVLAALKLGVNVVIGSSGLTAKDFKEIEAEAKRRKLGVIACGNFSITAALAKRFSLIAAEYIPHGEIIDYAHAEKVDVPSGTVRELAEEMASVSKNRPARSLSGVLGPKETRGADIAGTRVHSLRVPSYTISFETQFGLPDERLTIRHDSGSGAQPYIAGTFLAMRKVVETTGLIRGLDKILFGA